MRHDLHLHWIKHCKAHGLDPGNQHNLKLFRAGAEAENECCDEAIAKLHDFYLETDTAALDIIEECSIAICERWLDGH